MKIGDKILYDGKKGKVTNLMPGDMIDIQLDGADYVQRKHISVLAKANGGAQLSSLLPLLVLAGVTFGGIYWLGRRS